MIATAAARNGVAYFIRLLLYDAWTRPNCAISDITDPCTAGSANSACYDSAHVLEEEIDAAGIPVNDYFGLCRSAYGTGAAATNSDARRICSKSGETWPDHLQGSVRVVARGNARRPSRPALDARRVGQGFRQA